MGAGAAPLMYRLLPLRIVLLSLFVSFSLTQAFAASYDELRWSAVNQCQAIDRREYQSGLLFNPDGYRSYYVQSECFQKTALEFRDPSLCANVRQRRSLFSSSWGYSKANCDQLVAENIAADRKLLEEKRNGYLNRAIQLRDFRIERNGNGRDFDIIPTFTGEAANFYNLRFDILLSLPAGETVLLHASGYYLDRNSNLRLYVRQEDLQARLREFSSAEIYAVRATLILNVGDGAQGARWSDSFVERVFPAGERTQRLERKVRF
jgi:hypothetical protein